MILSIVVLLVIITVFFDLILNENMSACAPLLGGDRERSDYFCPHHRIVFMIVCLFLI